VEKRRGSMRALASEIAKVAAPALGKRGFAAAQLITEWQSIVGAAWADKVTPDRLSFPAGERRDATLRVRVASGLGPEVQHSAPLLLERINSFFGYRAVARLALVQGPPSRPQRPPPRRLPPPLAAAERQALDRRLAAVEDPDLRAALRRLGEAMGPARRG
jgi:hypothetical protein